MSSGNKGDSSKRGAIRRQRLRRDDNGGTPAGGPGWHPSPRRRPFSGPSSDGHAGAPRNSPSYKLGVRVALTWQRLVLEPLHQCAQFLRPVSALQPRI